MVVRNLSLGFLFISLNILFCSVGLSAASETALNEVRIAFIGDSITAGYGVLKEEAFPYRIEQLLAGRSGQKNARVIITNAGISGSLSSSASSRVRFYLKLKPQILVLELGANDVLKGTEVSVIQKNLADAIDLALHNNIKVLLLGMKIYTNFGASYTSAFAKIFSDLARDKKIEFMPFLLEGVALNKSRMQPDEKHPNADGHRIIAENLLKYLGPMIEKVAKK